MKNKVSLVVFDIAGTTVRDKDYVAIAFIEAFQHYGIELTVEEISPLMGFRKTEAIEKVLIEKSVIVTNEIVSDIHNHFVNAMVAFYAGAPEVEPLPGAEELFSILKQKGIRVALNSGFPKVIVDAIVDRLGWRDKGLLDDYIASDEVEMGRPFPLMIHQLMKRSGIVNAEEVVKVGDTMVDIQEGRMTGCGLVVAITTGAFSRELLAEYSPDIIIDSLLELTHHIE
jgi:phosphonatase-like hydrolase